MPEASTDLVIAYNDGFNEEPWIISFLYGYIPRKLAMC